MAEEEEKKEDIEDIKEKEKKQLRSVLFMIGFLVVLFLGIFFLMNASKQFNYKGVDFEVMREGRLILYRTDLPVKITDGVTGQVINTDYNIFFRTDPRKLENVPFDGKINIKRDMIMNFTENFNCDGYGVIAIANMMNLFDLLKISAVKNDSLGCNTQSKYTFLRLQAGNETGIDQVHTNCYDLTINNCEILEVTERYLLELLVKINEDTK